MAMIPTPEEEDAKRPNRERENLVSDRTRIVNRMKSSLARLGIRGFKPILRKAPERLARLLTPEGALLPPNTPAELCVLSWTRLGRSKRRAFSSSSRTLNKPATRWSDYLHR